MRELYFHVNFQGCLDVKIRFSWIAIYMYNVSTDKQNENLYKLCIGDKFDKDHRSKVLWNTCDLQAVIRHIFCAIMVYLWSDFFSWEISNLYNGNLNQVFFL